MICQNCANFVFNLTILMSIWCLIRAQNLVPQKFAIEPSDKTAIVGDTVILPCRVVNKVGTLQWTRDGFGLGTDRTLNGFPRYQMIGNDDEGDYSLQINSVSLEDDATFQCQVGAAEGVRGIRSRSASFSVFIAPEPPIIVQARAQGDYLRTTAGMTIELTCEAQAGKPPAELNWLDRDGNPVTKGITYTTQLLSDGKRSNAVSKWTFTASKDFDGQTLTCRSENAALKQPSKASIRLEVKYAPEVRLKISSKQILVGEDIEIICEANGNPNQLLYKWFKNDEVIVGDHGTRLVIRKLTKEMNGEIISCEASNSVGSSKAIHTLDISFEPSFKTAMDSVYGAEIGQDVKLKCDVEGNPKPDITWLLLGSSNVLNTGPELVIKDMTIEKVGKYMCRASVKGFPEISAQLMVFIKGPPRIKKPYVQYGFSGEAVKVECLIESVPPPTRILWHHNSQTVDVDNNQGYEIVEEPIRSDSTIRSAIVIHKSKLSDFGQYNCSVWNSFGFDSKIITLLEETLNDCLYDNSDPHFVNHPLCLMRANFSSLVVIVGLVICGLVIIVATTIIIILCLKHKSHHNDSYQNHIKKGVSSGTTSSAKHHSAMDSGSSGADSDIKVEIRTASSLSQHWDDTNEGSTSDQTVSNELSKVVENIYNYTKDPIYETNIKNIQSNRNGYIPYGDYDNNDYLQLPSMPSATVSPTHYRTSINIPPDRSLNIDPTYGTIINNRYHSSYANPYSRASYSSLQPNLNLMNNNNNNNQLNMFSTNQRFITTNEQKKSLATHV